MDLPLADPVFLGLAVASLIVTGISKGGFGGGAGFVASLILAVVFPPGFALGLMLPLLMLMDVATMRSFWRKWSWPDARILLLGSLPGIWLGSHASAKIPDRILRPILACMLLLIGGKLIAQ